MITDKEAAALIAAESGSAVTVNGSTTCVFARNDRNAFGKFEPDPASPSKTAMAEILATDKNGKCRGVMYLTRHEDLEKYSCSVFYRGKMLDVTNVKTRN